MIAAFSVDVDDGTAWRSKNSFCCLSMLLRKSSAIFSLTSTAALVGLGSGSPVELSFDGVGLFRRGWTWLLAGASAELAARQQRVVDAIACCRRRAASTASPKLAAPLLTRARVSLGQLPVAVAAVFDVLPLNARLDHAALVNSATGEVCTLPTLP